ncbi:hypothetical protein ACROYT_G021390 [Oculina patagonica]
MIEGCIVAKLVLGYLREEGLYRTCSAFQDECSLFHDDNKELDNVLLTADLKTILDDYSQLRESGRENGVPSSTAVLKSLWKDLDVVIGQLKYATIPSSTPNTSMGSQSTRTRRLNYGRTRRSMLPKNQESITKTASSPSTTQLSAKPSGSNKTEKLPLPRLSPVQSSPDLLLQSSSKNQTRDLQSKRTNRLTQNRVQLTADKEPVSVYRTPSTAQSVGSAVAISSPGVRGESQVSRTPIDITSTDSTVANITSDELSRNTDIVEGMFDDVDDGTVFNNEEFDHTGTENKSPPVIVIDDERSQEKRLLTVEEHSLSQSQLNQNELQLRSPKRKGIQPKKRAPQVTSGTSAVNDSPVKPVPESTEVEMDILCSSDTLTPQSFLGTLLSTPLLQEKLAENINKVVGSTRQQPASDEPPSDTMQSLTTTTEASSKDVLPAHQIRAPDDWVIYEFFDLRGAEGDIPVKEIMDLMQADPAFDVLFSFFGLDALDALPSAANPAPGSNTCTVLAEPSAGSSQLDKPTSCLSSSGANLPDALEAPSLPEECQPDSGKEITTMSTISDQQVETPCSSSASDLHLSATSIVTDALLLLAGSPQKIPPQVQAQLDHSASVLSSGKRKAVTPPKKTHSVQGRLNISEKRPTVDTLSSQASLVTSSFPYVRALDFNLDKGPEPVKRGKKRGSKTKAGTKQKTMTDGHSKAPLTKKGARSNRRHLEASKSPSLSSSPSAVAGYRNVQAISPSVVATNIYAGISQPIPSCSSVFNGLTNQISSTVVPSACSNTSPYHMINYGTLPTGLPVSKSSPAIRLSPSSGNLVTPSPGPVPSTVSYSNPGSGPTSSLVTYDNSISGPANFTSAVTSHSSPPVNHTSLRSSPVLVNSNNLSTYLTPSTVNITTCGTAPLPFISGNTSSVATSAPVNLTTQHAPSAPSTVSFINTVICPTSASTVNLVNMTNSHPALPASFGVSSVSSLHQVVNTVTSAPLTELTPAVISGHFTDSSVVTSTTSINNSLTSQEQNTGESNGSGTSSTNEGVMQPAVGHFSLQASNLLQSLALQHASTEKNEPQNIASGPDVSQLRKESAQGFQKTVASSTSESGHGHQPLKEKSTSKKNMNLSQENTTISSEKHKDDISVVCECLTVLIHCRRA